MPCRLFHKAPPPPLSGVPSQLSGVAVNNYHAVSVMYPQTTCLCGRTAREKKTTYTGARGEFSSTLLYLLLKREKRGERSVRTTYPIEKGRTAAKESFVYF